jgi:hypothetical protein
MFYLTTRELYDKNKEFPSREMVASAVEKMLNDLDKKVKLRVVN